MKSKVNTDSIMLELSKVYQNLADQLNSAASLAKTLHKIRNIRSSGNQIEEAFRATLLDSLASKYHVGHGHIIDKRKNISKQCDLVISDGASYRNIIKTKDSTELFFFESVYSIGEVKATLSKKAFDETTNAIKDLRKRLSRLSISDKTIMTGNHMIEVSQPVTLNPIRNPLFFFLLAVNQNIESHKIAVSFNNLPWETLPNITMILNHGLYILINKEKLKSGILRVHLYPEFVQSTSEWEWKFIRSTNSGQNLAYILSCLNEHLNNTILEAPSFLEYSQSIFAYDLENITRLEDM